MKYKFLFYYKKNGLGYNPTQAPTIKIVNTQGVVVASGQSLVNISTGLYYYLFETQTSDDYIGISSTTDLTVDEQNLVSWTPNVIIQNLDKPISNPVSIDEGSVEDIWNYQTRSVVGFGNLVSDIWQYGNRKLTEDSTNETNVKIFKTGILFLAKFLDEYLEKNGFINSKTDGYYEKLVKESFVEESI